MGMAQENQNGQSLGQNLRGDLIFDARMVAQCIKETLREMGEREHVFAQRIHGDLVFGEVLRKITCDISIALMLAKTLEDPGIFSGAIFSILSEGFDDKMVAEFAKALVRQDLAASAQDAVVDQCLPREIVIGRANEIVRLIDVIRHHDEG